MFTFLLSLLVAVAAAVPNVQQNSIKILDVYQTKILDGFSAEEKQFPYQVTFQYVSKKFPDRIIHFCGGSIISPRHILSAAHCFELGPVFGYDIVVKAGKLHLSVNESSEQTRPIANIDIHEKYGGVTKPYDIAIVTVNEPFEWNDYVKPIALPELGSEHMGDVTVSGWGSISPTSLKAPDELQYIEVSLLSREECQAGVDTFANKDMVDVKNICTGPLTGGHSACNGDSGGPLVQKDNNGENVLIGIVSWGRVPCGEVGAPVVYTKVSVFVEWIEQFLSL